jgi:prepilin-type N-terminal cleavage/methylation domain-containing protein
MRTRKVKRAFTLIEILIVVVILGILAAIVIPQFTDASQDAAESAAKSTLQTARSQVELYKFKENAIPADWAAMVTAGYLQAVPDADGFQFVLNADGTVTCNYNDDGSGGDTGW